MLQVQDIHAAHERFPVVVAANPIHLRTLSRQRGKVQPASGPEEVNQLREFIQSLDPDWEQAGQAYESMRRNLFIYFRGRHCHNPEDLADETLDRVSSKYKEARDLPRFVRGIARRVVSEQFRTAKTISIDKISEPRSMDAPGKEIDRDFDRLSKLDRLLEDLAPADREMVLAYYRFQGAEKIKNRQHLAAALNTSLETLAVRVLRVRRSLQNKWYATYID